jgi:putative ABC transport system permease protein
MPSYIPIGNLRIAAGRFFDEGENERATPVAVLGEGAKAALFGPDEAVGRYIKVNEQWLRVVGVAGPQLSVRSETVGVPEQDRNNLIYVPLWTAILRLEDNYSRFAMRSTVSICNSSRVWTACRAPRSSAAS